MIPWVLLDTARVPGDAAELRLLRRAAEFSIRLGHNELMNSRLSGSEKALAVMTCERLGARPKPAMLIGGLGMGFTLRAAQAVLPADAQIVVSELVPAVIAWARGPIAELFGESLADPRVDIRNQDVGQIIRGARQSFDAILLDVDNGPEALTHKSNDSLYHRAGLDAAYRALRPHGVLAVWSCAPDDKFAKRLQQSGFAVDEKRVRADGAGGGSRHVLWFATRS